MKGYSLQKVLLLTCLVPLCLASCRTAQFEANWSNDPSTWKEHLLNGVQVRVPSELPRLQMNPDAWWFVIKAKQVDNFSEGVRQAIQVSVRRQSTLPPEEVIKQRAHSIEELGGRVRVVESPVKGMQYFSPNGYEGKITKGDGMKGTVINGTGFGYFFISSTGALVNVAMYTTSHAPVNYADWRPETEIFPEQERKLVEAVAARVK
ncbi:MAG: hypothetical protein FD161_1321 [Limisphaerales bacterium]|nr:MAG: hypothetical protein FD161_1321 [Limisphaerales bacterium]KAG0509631.1 MAG: hypothetical protein E1N63_1240 [Limisphaerales bacterium]TXT49763.1 MAG: hypothetical protein FD140_2789 [Limisphaerales bacterium]